MNKPIKQIEKYKKSMLYHPALDIPERGMTGRYLPAGVDKDGTPLIEIEFYSNTLLEKVERMGEKE